MPAAQTTTAPDPVRLAQQLVDDYQPIRLFDLMEGNEERWEQLVAAVQAEDASSQLLTDAQREQFDQQLIAALPERLQIRFRELVDDGLNRELIRQEAAFLVGIEIGRRMGGAR